MRAAQKFMTRTLVRGERDGHRAHVCVICDELIIGTEDVCSLDKYHILKHKQRLSVESYNEFWGSAGSHCHKAVRSSRLTRYVVIAKVPAQW